MARHIFPDDAGRLVFSSSGQGSPLRSAADIPFVVYADEACTTPADITDLAGNAIAGSIIITDHESLLPNFYGPDHVFQLWILQANGVGTVSSIVAQRKLFEEVVAPAYQHVQTDPAAEWHILHNRQAEILAATFRDDDGKLMIVNYVVFSENELVASFPAPTTGIVDVVF
jgi:hypothetical protein